MDAEDLEATDGVRYADVDFTVEATKATQGRVNAVGSIGGGHDDDVRTLLQAVHEREKLGNDAALHFAVGLFTLGRYGVYFVDENDGGRVLLSRLEGLAQIALGLAR